MPSAPNARHVAMMVTTDIISPFRWCTLGGDDAERRTVGGNDLHAALALAVTRCGRCLHRLHLDVWYRTGCSDGPPQTLALPATLQVGLLTLRSGGTGTAQAVFTNVRMANR